MWLGFRCFLANPPCLPLHLQLIEGVALVASALPDGQRQPCVQQMLDIVVQPMQVREASARASGTVSQLLCLGKVGLSA